MKQKITKMGTTKKSLDFLSRNSSTMQACSYGDLYWPTGTIFGRMYSVQTEDGAWWGTIIIVRVEQVVRGGPAEDPAQTRRAAASGHHYVLPTDCLGDR
jgi:hypothetical protein